MYKTVWDCNFAHFCVFVFIFFVCCYISDNEDRDFCLKTFDKFYDDVIGFVFLNNKANILSGEHSSHLRAFDIEYKISCQQPKARLAFKDCTQNCTINTSLSDAKAKSIINNEKPKLMDWVTASVDMKSISTMKHSFKFDYRL